MFDKADFYLDPEHNHMWFQIHGHTNATDRSLATKAQLSAALQASTVGYRLLPR